jgi:hypothetical protein
MSRYNKDVKFTSSLETLLKIKENKELILKSKKLEDYVIETKNTFLALRLAIELDDRGIRTTKLQNFIIENAEPRLIFRFAKEIKKSNIARLQAAVISRGNILQIAKFGCFIKGADRLLIENIISKSDNAKAAYLYLKFVKFCNINKLKPIILKSKKPRYLFALAKLTKNNKDLNKIQDLIIESSSNTYVRLFAVHIKMANIERLEQRIIATKNIEEMKKFVKAVKSPRLSKLALLF